MLADFMCTGLNITFGLLLLALGTLALEIIWKTVRKIVNGDRRIKR